MQDIRHSAVGLKSVALCVTQKDLRKTPCADIQQGNTDGSKDTSPSIKGSFVQLFPKSRWRLWVVFLNKLEE